MQHVTHIVLTSVLVPKTEQNFVADTQLESVVWSCTIGIKIRVDVHAMKPSEFKKWRKDRGLTQEQAAKKLGLKKRAIQYYETGKRDGKDFKIPKTTELACYAISVGVEKYQGPQEQESSD